ncbi:hypothetical protein [Sphaerisporangium perillae]|uniref:hypothetical protein n=1 Tax=Sphaerisporangium perillae TaxID=2935860 RepID=UPI0020107D99|nr:hypothetical protein [Sphaerisporangium perillae]
MAAGEDAAEEGEPAGGVPMPAIRPGGEADVVAAGDVTPDGVATARGVPSGILATVLTASFCVPRRRVHPPSRTAAPIVNAMTKAPGFHIRVRGGIFPDIDGEA